MFYECTERLPISENPFKTFFKTFNDILFGVFRCMMYDHFYIYVSMGSLRTFGK